MSKLRAKMVLKKIIENQGKPMSLSKAMKAVGYSSAYAHNPQEFANTKTAQQLMDQYLPDELIAKTHHELLRAGGIQHYCFPKLEKEMRLTNDEIREIVESVPGCRLIYVKRDNFGAWAFYEAPDTKSRRDAVDMAYKRKGDYAAEKIELTKRKYQGLSNKELAEREALGKKFLLKK